MRRNLSYIIRFLFLSFFIWSCSKGNSGEIPEESTNDKKPALTAEQAEIISYFKEIALGSEFGHSLQITHKWTQTMNVFAYGSLTPEVLDELKEVIQEVNEMATDGFNMNQVYKIDSANFEIFMGTPQEYMSRYPHGPIWLLDTNLGIFSIFSNGFFEIESGHMYINTKKTKSQDRRHLLREELTQALGLANDSPRYPESIFFDQWTSTSKYLEIDKDLIQLLYHPKMEAGLRKNQVDSVLREILITESD